MDDLHNFDKSTVLGREMFKGLYVPKKEVLNWA